MIIVSYSSEIILKLNPVNHLICRIDNLSFNFHYVFVNKIKIPPAFHADGILALATGCLSTVFKVSGLAFLGSER